MQSKHAKSCKKEKWIDLFAVYENHGIVICCKNSCSETVTGSSTRENLISVIMVFGLSSVKAYCRKIQWRRLVGVRKRKFYIEYKFMGKN